MRQWLLLIYKAPNGQPPEADTVQEANLEPAAPGLDLICRGIGA